MPNDPLARLLDKTQQQIANRKGFADMRRTLATAHTAAYMLGVAERTGVAPKGLSRAERADVKAIISGQQKYLDTFKDDAGDMSDAAIDARADMYGGAVRSTYYSARHPGLSQYPGDGGTQCLTHCLCSLEERDDGIYWVLGGGEHCDDCQAMAAGSPYGTE